MNNTHQDDSKTPQGPQVDLENQSSFFDLAGDQISAADCTPEGI
jgi:hypothetical protein